MRRRQRPDGTWEWAWEEESNLSALDSGDLALYPVTIQWQRESEALQRNREAEQALAKRKAQKEAEKRKKGAA